MFAVKKDILSELKIPINKDIFGKNKTYRGLILMPLFAVVGAAIISLIDQHLPENLKLYLGFGQSIKLGALLGAFYIIFELPNSYFKRRAGIPPGKRPKKSKVFFMVIDRLDSTLGCIVVFYFFLNVPPQTLGLILVMGVLVHACITNILFAFNIRKEKW